MNTKNLSFKVINDNGEEITCDILSVIPNDTNSDEIFIVFTDYLLDDNNEFVLQYGRVIKENDEYVIKTINDDSTIDLIKDYMTDEIIDFANKQVMDKEEKELDTFTRKNDLGIDVEYTVIGYYDDYIIYTDFVSDNSQIGIKMYASNKNYSPIEKDKAKEIISKFNKEIIISLINERK